MWEDEPTGKYSILPEEIVPTKRYKTPGNGIIRRCPPCDGTGKYLREEGTTYIVVSCPACSGTGILRG